MKPLIMKCETFDKLTPYPIFCCSIFRAILIIVELAGFIEQYCVTNLTQPYEHRQWFVYQLVVTA